jgi:ATP-binding protein involved in chromosome partitioning
MKDDFSMKGEVIALLEGIDDPASGKNLVDAHVVEDVTVSAGNVSVELRMDKSRSREERFQIEDAVADAVEALAGVQEVSVITMTDAPGAAPSPTPEARASTPHGAPSGGGGHSHGPATMPASEPLQGVGRVIAVASGKGGVGKSTVAVNLALALKEIGHRVGLLDVDVYGPSLPTLLGVAGRPAVSDRRIVPIDAAGLKLMSLGFLMEDDTPVIWRGPIVTGIIRQFLRDVDWSGLDYLIVDMPPGTGDAQLALAQTVPVDGAIIVSTPSDLALIDAARGLQMFKTLNIDVVGVVSNMAKFVCPCCDEVTHIFGKDTVGPEAERLGTELIGEIPLDTKIREGGDEGRPVVMDNPESPVSKAFIELAERLVEAQPVEAEGGAPTQKKGLFSFLKG